MAFFGHKMEFEPVDPLGGGLAEEIAAEQARPEAIVLEAELDGEELLDYWQYVSSDSL